LSWNSV